jgi:hypothetical protein
VSEEKPKAPAGARPPPKLERVPAGYRPPPVRPAATPVPTAGASAPAAPPAAPGAAPAAPGAAPAAPPPQRAPGVSSYGIAAREVGADAAIAAGLAGQGTIGPKDSALHVFALAAAIQGTGRLTLTPEGRSYALSFRRGTVEHAASSDPEDDLGRFLVAKGALRPEGLARAEAAKGSVGGDLVSALIAERLVNPADVAGLLQEHGARLVQRALAVEAGGWSWNPQAAPPPGAFPLGAPWAMLCAAVRGLDATALMRRLGEREHRAAARIGGRIRIEDLRLTPQEARAAGLFDGARSPAELAAASPGDALVVLRIAVLLGDLQLLSFGASRRGVPPQPGPSTTTTTTTTATPPATPPATAKPPTATATPKPPAAAAPAKSPVAPAPQGAKPAAPVAPRPAAAPSATSAKPVAPAKPVATAPPAPPRPGLDIASLQALLAKLTGADHFAVLNVKQEATSAQLKIAYFQLAKVYHPDAVPAEAPAEVKKLCQDVFAKVSEAWSVLGDDAARADYLEQLKGGGTAEVDVGKIFEAENLFQTGTMFVKARNYAEGLKKFEEAIALNADEAEFGMWKAWCEFALAADKRKQLPLAAHAIEQGLKKNPRCAQGFLFLGQMAKIAGDLALAEKHLKRGLGIAPEHADLQRELKYLRK